MLFSTSEIENYTKNEYENMLSTRRYLHKHPELSFKEFETSKFIQEKLNQLGIKFNQIGETGVVATIGTGSNCIALRADIDALPILEGTELPFASKNSGVMHACGHDMHTTMLLSTAKFLKQNESKLKGIVKLIFQPGEEKLPGGASILIKEGVLENPVPEAVFGQHIFPGEEVGTVAIESGYIMGSADEIYWTIRGKGTHAAQPHLGHDPILAASQLVLYYQTLLTKYKNPLDPGVLTVSSIHGGSATNIIPEEVKMMGTLRSFNEEWRAKMHEMIKKNSSLIAEAYGCEVKVDIINGYPPVYNNPDITQMVENIAKTAFGDKVLKFEPKMWGEDFAFYSQKVPSCFWFIGVRPSDQTEMPALHNSKLNPQEEAMKTGTAMFLNIVSNWMK